MHICYVVCPFLPTLVHVIAYMSFCLFSYVQLESVCLGVPTIEPCECMQLLQHRWADLNHIQLEQGGMSTRSAGFEQSPRESPESRQVQP